MTRVANEYAQALYSLARDEGLDERLLAETRVLRDVVSQNPGFVRILSAPNISKEERCAVLDRCLGGRVHPYVLNLGKLMTEKGYAWRLADCFSAYETLFNEDHGVLPVKAVTAVPLTGEQSARLRERLEAMTGKRVELTGAVDPACLGGVRLDYDGKRLDDTLRHRLDAIRSALENTML